MIPSLILATAMLLQTATAAQPITALKSRAEAADSVKTRPVSSATSEPWKEECSVVRLGRDVPYSFG